MQVQLINNIKDLENYKNLWNKLLDNYQGKDIFLTYEWITIWWKHFGKDNELYILFVWNKQQLCGIAPLMKVYKGPFIIVQFIGHPRHSDRMDFIIDQEHSPIIVKAILDYLMDRERDWHLIYLRQFSTLAKTPEILSNILGQYRIRFLYKADDICFYIPLFNYKNGFKQYLKENRSPRGIKSLFRYRKKIIKNNFKKYDYYSLHNNIYSQIVDLDRNRSIRGKRGLSFFSNVKNIDFLRDIIDKFSYSKNIKIKTYIKEEKIVCYILLFIFNNKLMAYQTAFDSQYRQYSLGTMIILDTLEDAFQTGYLEFDFLRGEESYKSLWTHNYRQNKRILIFRCHPLSKILHLYYKKIKPLKLLIK